MVAHVTSPEEALGVCGTPNAAITAPLAEEHDRSDLVHGQTPMSQVARLYEQLRKSSEALVAGDALDLEMCRLTLKSTQPFTCPIFSPTLKSKPT